MLLVARTGPVWRIAFHRFAEVSIDIGVALVLAVIWPEGDAIHLGKEQIRFSGACVDQGTVNGVRTSAEVAPPTAGERF